MSLLNVKHVVLGIVTWAVLSSPSYGTPLATPRSASDSYRAEALSDRLLFFSGIAFGPLSVSAIALSHHLPKGEPFHLWSLTALGVGIGAMAVQHLDQTLSV